mmetsp:Transcript_36620/g.86105  ORF Transcript_36620/g.86105 Transcript_36620/m.86105 type:complete len:307 (-) Transcript_36620:423-1343(-)
MNRGGAPMPGTSQQNVIIQVASFVHRRTHRALVLMDDFVRCYECKQDGRQNGIDMRAAEQAGVGGSTMLNSVPGHLEGEGNLQLSASRGMDCETNPIVSSTAHAGSDFTASYGDLQQSSARAFHHALYEDNYWVNTYCASNRDSGSHMRDIWDEVSLLSVAGTEDKDSESWSMSSRTSLSMFNSSCQSPDQNPDPPASSDVSSGKLIFNQAVAKVINGNHSQSEETEHSFLSPFRGVGEWVQIPLGSRARAREVRTPDSSSEDVDSVSSAASLSDASIDQQASRRDSRANHFAQPKLEEGQRVFNY